MCDGFLTGVVSWGPIYGFTNMSCGDLPLRPGVYADVAFYNEWIKEKLRTGKDEL